MAALTPEGAGLSELSSTRPRAASLGLAVVVAFLAVFSIFGAYTTQRQVDVAERSASLHNNYQKATAAILEIESLELEYLQKPSPERLIDLESVNAKLADALNEIAAGGTAADAQFASDMFGLNEQYLGAIAQLIAAAAAGNRDGALRFKENEADPVFKVMQGRIAVAMEQRAAEAEAAVATLRSTAQWALTLTPIVFALGFALLYALWRILERYQRAAHETYRRIEQLSEVRSEFVSIVSHEFRTPLTGIQGFSEMMRDEDLTVEEMREYAGDINKDARRLARLISDMLDLDRMESGRMTLNIETVDINRIVADAVAPFRIKAKNHPIDLALDERIPTLSGDADRLTQVVTNLVSNAIKYSPNGGAVVVSTKREGATVVLSVSDEGIGIPTEELEKIFERYSRVHTTETRGIQGTGLGLPIVRQIVQMHSGRVWATSEPSRGSVFHIQLPISESATLAHRAA